MAERDYYDTLGLARGATADEIKRSFRRLAKKYHPDKNAGDATAEGKFKEVQAAYGVLSDAEKRAAYDQFGHAGPGAAPSAGAGSPSGPPVTWTHGGEPIDLGDLGDLFDFSGMGGGAGGSGFEQFFRGQGPMPRGPRRPAPGKDVEHNITLTFEQAVRGISIEMRGGDGDSSQSKIMVRVPPGVRDGQRIRLRGKGHPSTSGGPPGDLYIKCTIKPHAFFRREGHDILLEAPITLDEAALGAKVDLPTLDGTRTVTIPPGTASGAKLRLGGLGIESSGGSRGDQIVLIRIVPPGSLTDDQRDLLRRFAESGRACPREGLWS